MSKNPTGLCSAHQHGEDKNCKTCYPAQAIDLQTHVRHQLEQITKEYLEHYGCNSCWSDAHQCTCSHDKYVIMAFVDNLKSKIKKDV